ncbi:MAG: molybdenum cofactor guanylyltransferase MobA [Brachymonas denitrificans]
MTEQALVTGLILAGGEGRRMGGQDKGWIALASQPLVSHVLARLRPQVSQLQISANRHLEEYRTLGFPVITDDAQWQGMGPMAALATVAPMLADTNGYLQLVPCDAPLLPDHLVRDLLAALQKNPALEIAYPQCGDRPQPAMLLAKCSALASAAAYLASGQRSLRGWIANRASQAVAFDDVAAFANANDPAALLQLEHRLSHDA